MIVFEVRSDGTVVSTPSLVAQGTSLSDLVVLADADYSLVTMHFTHPSGIYIPDIVFTPTHTQGRSLWQAVMPPEISRISGAVTYQIFLTSADGKTLATPTGRITVQEGVISNMPETAEELGQYSISALYQLMANFYASLEGYRQTLDGLTVKTHKWTILASDWTDSTPYQASIVFPHGNYAKPGTLILVAPADNRSREQIEKCELTVTVHDNGVIGDVPFVDTAVIVRGGKAPTEDINLVLFFIDTQGKDEPMTQWIGVDMGTGLPEVTPEDDGKVLIVEGDEWTVGALPNNLRATLHITLKANAWPDNKQTIEAAEVAENCTLVVNPTEGSKDAYIASVIELSQELTTVGSMVFTCVKVPKEDIEVLVHVVDPLITAEGGAEAFVVNITDEGATLGGNFLVSDKYSREVAEAYLTGKTIQAVLTFKENTKIQYVSDRFEYNTDGLAPTFKFYFSGKDHSNSSRDREICVNLSTSSSLTFWTENPYGYWRNEEPIDLTDIDLLAVLMSGGTKTYSRSVRNLRIDLETKGYAKIKYKFAILSVDTITSMVTANMVQFDQYANNMVNYQFTILAAMDTFRIMASFLIVDDNTFVVTVENVNTSAVSFD